MSGWGSLTPEFTIQKNLVDDLTKLVGITMLQIHRDRRSGDNFVLSKNGCAEAWKFLLDP